MTLKQNHQVMQPFRIWLRIWVQKTTTTIQRGQPSRIQVEGIYCQLLLISSTFYSNGSIIMQQHSGVGIYQVVNPVIRDTVRPIPTVNQIGMPKRKFFRWVLLISTLKLLRVQPLLEHYWYEWLSFCGEKIESDCSEDEGDYLDTPQRWVLLTQLCLDENFQNRNTKNRLRSGQQENSGNADKRPCAGKDEAFSSNFTIFSDRARSWRQLRTTFQGLRATAHTTCKLYKSRSYTMKSWLSWSASWRGKNGNRSQKWPHSRVSCLGSDMSTVIKAFVPTKSSINVIICVNHTGSSAKTHKPVNKSTLYVVIEAAVNFDAKNKNLMTHLAQY